MKVLMLNGSRKEQGCTYTALSLVGESLAEAGIETEIVHIGVDVLKGKVDALVKEVGEKSALADGLVIGSPVYYAGPSGEIKAFLDRLFSGYAEAFRYKPGAAVTSARRAGTTATLEVLQKYLTYTEMPLVSSCYWPMVHGSKPEDVMKDEEGVHIMHVLGRNMAWLLKSIEAGKQSGVEQPVKLEKPNTNFIR